MFLNSVGIILRKNELSPYKMIILDKIQGKIECVTTNTQLSPGSLVSYTMQQKGLFYFISDMDLIYVPLSLAQTDMLFFHHALELIYYFTHIGNCTKEVFAWLAFLYSAEHTELTMQTKKLFLLKLHTSMGNVPETIDMYTNKISNLNMLCITELATITISSTHEKELDRWLWCCVWQHPYVNEFKTVHFLAENRTP